MKPNFVSTRSWSSNSNTINKYELITETGHLKLDRVGYSSLAYPFAYGCIPRTWDEDGDPLDIEIVGVTEPLIPGSIVEARIIGVMTFDDGGEVDDKVIAVLADDKRMDHIKSWEDLGEHWKKETTYYWEHYKDLKKPGTCSVNGFFGTERPLRSSRAARLATWLRLIPSWSTERVGDRLLIRRGHSPAFSWLSVRLNSIEDPSIGMDTSRETTELKEDEVGSLISTMRPKRF